MVISHDWRPFIYGGLASIMAEFGTYPIDTTKTRLQIQGQKIDKKNSELKYKGMIHALARISKEEGTKALYSGISPALLRQATYGTIKIGVYYTAKKKLVKNPNDENMLTNVVCGIFAGVVSSSLANPTDVLKVRMQAKDATLTRMSMLQCFADMYRKEGLGGLWRGVCPTAQRAAIVVGVELPAYDAVKRQLIKSGTCGDTVVNHLISSFLAGLAGAVASNPIDVVRTRLMSQRRFKPAIVDGIRVQAIYTSSLDCLLQTVKSEGFFALYKGFVPTWVRLGPWNVIFFVTYEQLKKMY